MSIYGQVLGGTKYDSCYQRLRIEITGNTEDNAVDNERGHECHHHSQADAFSAGHFITQLNLALPQRRGRLEW